MQDKYFAGVVLNEFYVNVCIPQLKLINFIFLFVMEAFAYWTVKIFSNFSYYETPHGFLFYHSTPCGIIVLVF